MGTEADHLLRIWLLGGFRAELDGSPVGDAAWRRNRSRALVKLLALAPDHRLHREQLMDELWPTLDPAAAAANLRKAVHFARQAVGREAIRVKGEIVELDASTWVDVQAFEAAVGDARGADAIAAYTGDLLPEDRFEAWTDEPRERLRAVFHRLLLELALDREQSGDLAGTRSLLERLVAADPLHEDAHLALVRVHALAGERHLAVRLARQFESRLRQDLEVAPAEAMQRLHAEIVGGRFPPSRVSGSDPSGADAQPTAGEDPNLDTGGSAEPLTAGDDPEHARRDARGWSNAVRLVIAAWEGTVEPQAGGSLVAVFGVPVVHEDDAARGLRAALEILERAPLPTRIGIATGEVIIDLGSASATPIVGEVVVQADRLRSRAGAGEILVSERARRAAGAGFRYDTQARVGGGAAGLRRLAARVAPMPRTGRHETTFVGREAELVTISGLLDDAVRTGQPRLVLLVGVAGVGKSRLVREVTRVMTTRDPTLQILRGRCPSGGQAGPFAAFGELLRNACGISIDEPIRSVHARLRSKVTPVLEPLDPRDAAETQFALATTAGIVLPDNPLDNLPPDQVAKRLALAWPTYVSALGRRGPTIVVIEDLHWASPELIELVEAIATRSTGPVLIMATSRPELLDRHSPASAGPVSLISLAALPPMHSEALLDAVLPGTAIEERERAQILARAEGNPFYLEELALHVRDDRPAALPDTLQSLLSARLDSLPVPERRVLQEASVVGRAFWLASLVRALPDPHVDARLAALERSGFIVRRPSSSLPGQAEFLFRHALLHDVAYESLPKARRARAHAAVAAWLEELSADRIDEVVDLLAHHFSAALEPDAADLAWPQAAGQDQIREQIRDKALRYLMKAGNAARRRFATERAVGLHERALELARQRSERLHALEAIADDEESAYHGDAAEARYREAIALARHRRSRSPDLARLCRKLGWLMAWNPGSFAASPDPAVVEALVQEGLAARPDDVERAWLQLVDGAVARLYRGSEPFGQGPRPDSRPLQERIALVEAARATGQRLGRNDLVVAGGQTLGLLYGVAGRYDDVVDLAREEVARLSTRDSRLDQGDAIRKLAVHLINVRADFEQGLELGERARAVAGDGNPHQVMHMRWPVMTALFYLGRYDDVLAPLAEHLAAFRKEPATECQFVRDGPAIGAATLSVLGRAAEAWEVAGLLGDPLADRDSASAWQARSATLGGDPATARAISWDKAFEGRMYGPQHAFALIEALAALKDWQAIADLLPGLRGAVRGNALLRPMIDRVEGQVLLASGKAAAGQARIRRAVKRFHELKTPYEEQQALELLRPTASPRAAPLAGR